MKIHPSAVISPRAELGRDVVVGPFCVIEAGVEIGDGCQLDSHAVVKEGTVLGRENHLFEGVVLGGLPQHVRPPPCPGRLRIGSHNTLREHVTIHRALDEHRWTVVGDSNLLMVNAHVAHDATIGNHTIMANNVMLAGHVAVDDRAYLSGAVGVHQFCRIGGLAMVGGQSKVVKDVPPFVTIDGSSSYVVGLNLVGLKRAGFTAEQVLELKAAYRLIYRSGLSWTRMLVQLREEFPSGPAARFHEFFMGGKRGFVPERRMPPGATLKLPLLADEAELKSKAG